MSEVSIGIRKNESETWRQAVERQASRHGLQVECLEDFDEALSHGQTEGEAAWRALYNWDVLDLYVDGEPERGGSKA